MFGVSRDTVRKDWVARGMPGRTGAFPIPEIIQWRIKDATKRPTARDESGDPDLDGVESEGLERYRLAKAQLAELELQRKRGEVGSIAMLRTALNRIATRLRGVGEQLERRFGVEAAEILRNAIRAIERDIDDLFSEDGNSDGDASGDDQRSALAASNVAGSESSDA